MSSNARVHKWFYLWCRVIVHQCAHTAGRGLCPGLLLQRSQHLRGGQRAGGPGSASGTAPVPARHILGLLRACPPDPACFCWQNMPLPSLHLVSLCLLYCYFSLFLFLKSFEANGSSKGCSARNVFVTIKGCFT